MNLMMRGDGQEMKQIVEILTQCSGRVPQADGSSHMTALNEQLGLKLDSVKDAVTVGVIDSVEAASED